MDTDLIIFRGKQNYVRTKELLEKGITNYKIMKLIDAGELEKIHQGLYMIIDPNELVSITLEDINVIVENGIVSMESAVFYYELANGDKGTYTITLHRDQKPPKLDEHIFKFYYTSGKFYELGLNIIDQNGKEVRIYDMERTICDLLKHRSKVEPGIIREVFINYLDHPDRDMEKLMRYARELRVYNVLMQYLELLL